jgi:hypothetical protein
MTAAPVLVPPPRLKRAAIHGPGRPDKYLDARGEQVASVTTITGRFKDSGALIAWAHRQGMQQIPLNEARDKAADAGHVTHTWIQDTLAGRERTEFPFTPDDIIDKAAHALTAFEDWAMRVELEVVATEVPLVHSKLGYGGTFDGIGILTTALGLRALMLLDWKSGKSLYPEHLVQLAAYRELLRDAAAQLAANGRAEAALPVPEGGVLIKLDKETGMPHPREFDGEALDLGWRAFNGERELYGLDKALSKMVAEPKKKRGKAA